jgi:hypothetical protein
MVGSEDVVIEKTEKEKEKGNSNPDIQNKDNKKIVEERKSGLKKPTKSRIISDNDKENDTIAIPVFGYRKYS